MGSCESENKTYYDSPPTSATWLHASDSPCLHAPTQKRFRPPSKKKIKGCCFLLAAPHRRWKRKCPRFLHAALNLHRPLVRLLPAACCLLWCSSNLSSSFYAAPHFFREKEEFWTPTRILLKGKSVQLQSCDKESRKLNHNNYTKASSHKSIWRRSFIFALRIIRANSFLKTCLHLGTEWGIFLKMISFRMV